MDNKVGDCLFALDGGIQIWLCDHRSGQYRDTYSEVMYYVIVLLDYASIILSTLKLIDKSFQYAHES